MKLTLKLYAGLSQFLPDHAENNVAVIEITNNSTANHIIDMLKVPRERASLVLLNGIYINPEERDTPNISDGDTLAIWPPVSGG